MDRWLDRRRGTYSLQVYRYSNNRFFLFSFFLFSSPLLLLFLFLFLFSFLFSFPSPPPPSFCILPTILNSQHMISSPLSPFIHAFFDLFLIHSKQSYTYLTPSPSTPLPKNLSSSEEAILPWYTSSIAEKRLSLRKSFFIR